ncbi:hypothetical protein GQ53DRAFT_759076 [Thozetella sp. PMI_491]|nr:hypothetical protein GQ53DRAFT_759076 [Thozetella sp. PMI_491]
MALESTSCYTETSGEAQNPARSEFTAKDSANPQQLEKKHRMNESGGGDEEEDEVPLRPPKQKRRIDTGQPTKLFACPFWKRDPGQHRQCFAKKLCKISSPYMDPELSEDLHRFREYCEYRGPDLLARALDSGEIYLFR